MMNLYELEMQMKENTKRFDKEAKGTHYVQVPMMDWLLGTVAAAMLMIW